MFGYYHFNNYNTKIIVIITLNSNNNDKYMLSKLSYNIYM